MKKFLIPIISCIIPVLYACTDSDYDLSDIDTNARFKVNDLIVPVNLDAITLDCVLDLDEGSIIKKNGDEYAVIDSGDFTSDPILVKDFPVNGREESAQRTIELKPSNTAASTSKRAKAGHKLIAYANIPKDSAKVSASVERERIDSAVISFTAVGTKMDVTLSLQFTGLTNIIDTIDVEDLKIQFIKGLKMTPSTGSYNSSDGLITVGKAQTDRNHNHILSIKFDVTGLNAEQAGVIFDNDAFSINSSTYVKQGRLALYRDQIISYNLPDSVGYKLIASVNDFSVTSFSGRIQYDIKDITRQTVDLNNIPEMLSAEGTNIFLENPQIYLKINNPMRQKGYALNAQAGLSLTGNNTYSTSSDAVVLDRADNIFLLSPHVPQALYTGFENAKHVPFPDLGKVLSGNAIPKQIIIDILKPMIPEQSINNFILGETLPGVEAKWLLYAPLDLTENSMIKYSKTWDDWQDEDLDGLTVQKGEITATFSSDVPLALDITFTLLGRNGQMSGNAILAANAKDVVLTIPLAGTDVSQIYGLTIDARIKGNGQSLSPSQQISVKNLRAKVSGYYDREL